MPWLIPAIGAGLGLVKHVAVDKPAADKAADMRAAEQRYEPYTGMQPQTQVKTSDPFGAALGGAGSAQALSSGMDLDKQRQQWLDLQKPNAVGNLTKGLKTPQTGGASTRFDTKTADYDTSGPWSGFLA